MKDNSNSEAYYGPTLPDSSRAAMSATTQLRTLMQEFINLELDIAHLQNALASTGMDFESGIELTAAELDKAHELECLKQDIWTLLRKEFV